MAGLPRATGRPAATRIPRGGPHARPTDRSGRGSGRSPSRTAHRSTQTRSEIGFVDADGISWFEGSTFEVDQDPCQAALGEALDRLWSAEPLGSLSSTTKRGAQRGTTGGARSVLGSTGASWPRDLRRSARVGGTRSRDVRGLRQVLDRLRRVHARAQQEVADEFHAELGHRSARRGHRRGDDRTESRRSMPRRSTTS